MSKVQITAFTGEYHFLSNYCACPVTIDGLTYRSAEAAFQAAKCNVPIDRAAFCTVPPNVAKAIGRKIKLRKGWEKSVTASWLMSSMRNFLRIPPLHRLLSTLAMPN